MTDRTGDNVGCIDNYVFRYSESSDEGVSKIIHVNDLDLEAKTEYILRVSSENPHAEEALIGTTTVRTDKEAKNVTLPISFVREHDRIRAGQMVSLNLYEKRPLANEDLKISDSSTVLGRSEVVADPTVSDGCDARLTCKRAAEEIPKGGEMLKFRNTRTQTEKIVQSHSDFKSDKYQISFPMDAREAIGAQPNDLVEIIRPAEGETDVEQRSQKEIVEETHRMVSEMYESYLQQVNE